MLERRLTREEIYAHNQEVYRKYNETINHNAMFPENPVVEYDYIHEFLSYEDGRMQGRTYAIVEERRTNKNGKGEAVAYENIGFYIKDDEVFFRHCFLGSDEVDDWFVEETFPIGDFRSGIKELVKKGFCSIQGADLSKIGGVGCETMSLRKISDGLMVVNYSGLQKRGTIHLKCDVNKLVL
jgi:hypothetical protein